MRLTASILLPLFLTCAACGGTTSSASSTASNDGGAGGAGDGSTADPGSLDAGTWSNVAAPAVGELYDIWGSSATNAWIAGETGLLHFDGKAWSKYSDASTAALSTSTFSVVTGTAANDVWIMGGTPANPFAPAFSHFDGSSWSAPSNGTVTHGQIYGGFATAKNDVWAVGRDDGQTAGIVMHYDGAAWSLVHSDTSTDLFSSVWASGPNDVWISGHGGIVHYDGHTWIAAGVMGDNAPHSIGSLSGTAHDDVWAVGLDANAFNPAVLHFDGTTWSVAHAGTKSEDFIGVFSPSRGVAITLGSEGIDDSHANALIGVVNGAAWGSEQVTPPGGALIGQFTRAWAATEGGTWIIGDEILHRD